MYQLAPEARSSDRTRLFIESCTSMAPTTDNLGLVGTLARIMRDALASSDTRELRDYVAMAASTDGDIDDALAAAGQAVVDEHDELPFQKLHDLIRRVAQIEREALNPARRTRDTFRTVYAG